MIRLAFLLFTLSFRCLPAFAHPDSLKLRHGPETISHTGTIGVSISNFSIAGITPFDHLMFTGYIANQLGAYAEYALYNGPRPIKIYFGYNEWNLNPFFDKILYEPAPYTSYRFVRQYVQASRNFNEPGALRFRKGYRMADAAATTEYRIGHHCFTGGLGASLTWGKSYYLEQRYFNTSWNSFMYVMREEQETYVGIFLPVRYDLLFIRDRFAVGVQGSARKYFGLQSLQIDYGVHLAVNLLPPH